MIETNVQEEIISRKVQLIKAGFKSVDELIKVAEDDILKAQPSRSKKKGDDDSEMSDVEYSLAADRLKNAAGAKKLAIFDALEILAKIQEVQADLDSIENGGRSDVTSNKGFAERHADKGNS